MSIVAMKKKSEIQHSSKVSGRKPGGIFLSQGPFGKTPQNIGNSFSSVGFSLNGSHRNVGYIGKTYQMSESGTPFRGINPIGHGGTNGKYISNTPLLNVLEPFVLGDQSKYVAPSVLSNYGMLTKKYRWIKGAYPNHWVQPNYGGTTQSDTKSQGLYIENLSKEKSCVNDINNMKKYENYVKKCNPSVCKSTPSKYTFNNLAQNGPYTKILKHAQTSSEHLLKIQRKCIDQTNAQKPYPPATNGNANCNT